ncbi:signal transduction histidine kinase [Clostridium sp. SY8519]|uniref:ATP-binding protein n=1 Tax=Clostridium sp. (strain SY8519) TaxID=1042156 RepID=UPI0002171DB0|nr:ATP-binding protein [Clostridium sp. SY8519]BAK48336.1 signal transduction histidine kinase [Clostridium sp. SY8519]
MLPEISLTILDIAQNSITAKAADIFISVLRDTINHTLTFTIRDNGTGMDEEQLKAAVDPFYTTRTTRKIGLGIPFLQQSAECTGGSFSIASEKGKGTSMQAVYCTDSIDCMPLGDIAETIYSLVVFNEGIHFVYHYRVNGHGFDLDTDEIRKIIGDTSFAQKEIAEFIHSYLKENTDETDAYGEQQI